MITNEQIPLSEATAYGIWSQLRHQIATAPTYALEQDPLSKDERKLYNILTWRFQCEAAILEITMEEKKP